MAALSKDRNTPMRDGAVLSVPAAASQKFYAGALAAINATGYATPGATATTLIGAGRVESQVDNTTGGDGEAVVAIRKGIFRYDNDGTDTVTRAHIGQDCYMVNDQSVASNDGTGSRSVAGKVFDVDPDGVWVRFD